MKNFTLLLIALIFQYNAFAQWTTDTDVNTLVATSNNNDVQAIGTSDGQTYVVFWKVVSAPTNYELRLQVLDVDGNQQLGDDGMLISDNIPMSTWTAIWSVVVDDNDNLYVGATGTEDGSGHAFKMDINGNQLWSEDGVSFPNAFFVIILPLETGEAIVAWNDVPNALMQKYDADGNTVWNSPQPVISGSSKTSPGDLYEMSNGDYILVFHTYNFGISSTLFAQRYNPNGEAQWTTPTQLSDKGTVFNTVYSSTQSGDTIYYGYMASSTNRFDSYLQRINPDGTLPWGINGMDFDINQTDYEMGTKIAYSEGSQYVWSICTYRNTNQSESGEYVQKFDKTTGERQFTDNAKVIYPISSNDKVHASNLYIENNQALFLLKIGFDNGATPVTLNTVLLDENGDFVWPEEYQPVATFNASKGRIGMTQPVNGQSVTVFVEDKGDGEKIYAQNFIDALPLPTQPVLLTPENEAIDIPIIETFSWEPVQGADSYELQVSTDDAFTNLIVDETGLVETSFDDTLPSGETTYFWRVNASNGSGTGDWSETWSFTTEVLTGIDEISAEFELIVYPNPAKNNLFIAFKSPVSTIVQIRIYSAVGNIVNQVNTGIQTGNNKIDVDVSGLPAGTYFYRISGNEVALYGRFSTL